MFKNIFSPELIKVNLESSEKDELFEEMVEMFASSHSELDRDEILSALMLREAKMTTGIIPEIAIPHAIVTNVTNPIGVIGISRSGIDYDSLDKMPVKIVVMLLLSDADKGTHLKVMQSLVSVFQKPNFIQNIMSKLTPQEVYNELLSFEEALE